jgi:putative flippase GtrA
MKWRYENLEDIKLNNVHRFLLFCFVGGVATLLDLLCFNFVFKYTSMFVLSRIAGIAFSMVWNFNANRHMTYQAKEGKPTPQLIKYLIVYGIAMGLNVFIGWTVYQIIGPGQIPANIAAITGLAVSIPTAFFGSLLWAFKTEKIKRTEDINK